MDHPKTCFVCEVGEYKVVVKDFDVTIKDGRKLTVPEVTVLCCPKCGEETLPPDSSAKIEDVVRKNGGYDK